MKADSLRSTPVLDAYLLASLTEPDNAETYRRLAQLDADNRQNYLARAVTLEPFDADSILQLGLYEETSGNRERAHRWLLRAARVDHTYLPAWTLANYEFRQGNTEAFWKWARKAAAMCPGDFRPLFELCFRETDDAVEIDRRVITGRELAGRRFLGFLMETGRIDEAGKWIESKGPRMLREHPDLGEVFVDGALRHGYPLPARGIWNRLCGYGFTGFGPVGSGAGGYVTNANFGRELSGRGFDWRPHRGAGYGIYRRSEATGGEGNSLQLELSGEGTNLPVLEQYLCVLPGRELRLRWRYRASGLGPLVRVAVGLRFDGGPAPTAVAKGLENTEEWRTDEWVFQVPAEYSTARLSVLYSAGGLRLSPAVVELSGFQLAENGKPTRKP